MPLRLSYRTRDKKEAPHTLHAEDGDRALRSGGTAGHGAEFLQLLRDEFADWDGTWDLVYVPRPGERESTTPRRADRGARGAPRTAR
jgi:hypothetical protein